MLGSWTYDDQLMQLFPTDTYLEPDIGVLAGEVKHSKNQIYQILEFGSNRLFWQLGVGIDQN